MRKKCPTCGRIINVANDAPADMMIKCGDCKATNLLCNYLDVDVAETPVSVGTRTLPKFVDMHTAKEYSLAAGEHVVGKKKQGSLADVQLETDSRYVSRNQCYAEVIDANGRYKTCIAHHERALNQTMVGEEQLCNDDVMVLNDGDIINICGFQLKYIQ